MVWVTSYCGKSLLLNCSKCSVGAERASIWFLAVGRWPPSVPGAEKAVTEREIGMESKDDLGRVSFARLGMLRNGGQAVEDICKRALPGEVLIQ